MGKTNKMSHKKLFFIGILIFSLVRRPCKISESYDNPCWDFINRGKKRKEEDKKKRRLITENSGLPKLLRWSHARSDQDLAYLRWTASDKQVD